jgi:hypothetical protein
VVFAIASLKAKEGRAAMQQMHHGTGRMAAITEETLSFFGE